MGILLTSPVIWKGRRARSLGQTRASFPLRRASARSPLSSTPRPVESMNVTPERSTTTLVLPSSASPSRRRPSWGAVRASISPLGSNTWVVSSTGSSQRPNSTGLGIPLLAWVAPTGGSKLSGPGRPAMHRLWRMRAPHPGGERLGHGWLRPAAANPRSRGLVVPDAAAAAPAAQGQAHDVAARPVVPRPGVRAFSAAPVVAAGIVAVVAQAEEPDQPHDQEPHVEDAEPDHEDPPLGGHQGDATATRELPEGGPGRYLLPSVGRGSET